MIPFNSVQNNKKVTEDTMKHIRELLDTPYKKGAVLKYDQYLTDSPTVFKLGEKWYMMYLRINKNCACDGYETRLAQSDDLVNWKDLGDVLSRNDGNNWDSKQIAGYLGLIDTVLGRNSEPNTVNGDYLVTYLGGNADGYEPTPLYMGLARTKDIKNKAEYIRNEEPLFSPDDADVREGETLALYRSLIFYDKKKVTGYPYVIIYNAKDDSKIERIFLGVSNDGISFERYGENCVFDPNEKDSNIKIAADAQILEIDDLYVMIYFVLDYSGNAYSTFACSYDLVNWTNWNGEPLIKSELPFESRFAHKSFIIQKDGVVYNYYCATNDKEERFIALATSKK